MVGLPARGKTYISKKLTRYLNWIGVPTKGEWLKLIALCSTVDCFYFRQNNDFDQLCICNIYIYIHVCVFSLFFCQCLMSDSTAGKPFNPTRALSFSVQTTKKPWRFASKTRLHLTAYIMSTLVRPLGRSVPTHQPASYSERKRCPPASTYSSSQSPTIGVMSLSLTGAVLGMLH